MNFLQITQQYGDAMLGGLFVTLKLSFIVWASGIVIGSALGALGASFREIVGGPSKVVSVILAGMPALVFLFWMHYPLQGYLQIVINPFITGALTLSIINIFMVADLVRGAITDFPRQYIDAAKVSGMSHSDIFVRIQVPLLMRQIIPGLLLIQITVFQMTIFASMISVDEIFRVAQRVNSIIYKPVEIYTLLALFFIAVCVPLNLFAHWLRVRFTRDYSER
ncbi:MAG: ABC transporter permease subunit [Desulfuromonadales bacterium]|nr:ABC transporter permease subunit [Desulfuromonadales bacterium]